jgi:heat shock protein HslJ
MSRFFMASLALSLLTVSACAGGGTLSRNDLVLQRFTLAGVDGQPFNTSGNTSGPVPELSFAEDFSVSGSACNRFRGQGELSGNRLTVKVLASTKMLCFEPARNELESMLFRMLAEGADVEFSGDELVLRQGGHTLAYTRQSRQSRQSR